MKTPHTACLVVAALALVGAALVAQTDAPEDQPFEALARRSESAWAGAKRPLVQLFNKERKRLGERFEAELLKFVAENVDRHYWCGLFLTDAYPDEEFGGKPQPHLALLLWHQGMVVASRGSDLDSLGDIVRLSKLAAVLSAKQGFAILAAEHKKTVEKLLAERPILKGCCPAMSGEEHGIYEGIKID